MTEAEQHQLAVRAFENAVTEALKDDILSEDDEKKLIALGQRLSLSQKELNTNWAFRRTVKAAVIREILAGVIPQRIELDTSSVNLEKDEIVVWAFADTPYYEDRTQRSWVGSSHGISVRIMKGVYYRTSAFEGHPVERRQRVAVDTGLLLITNKNLYFSGPEKSLRLPYKKIVSFQPFSDGFGLTKDAVTAKPQIFVTGDGWFAYNLVTNLAHMCAGLPAELN